MHGFSDIMNYGEKKKVPSFSLKEREETLVRFIYSDFKDPNFSYKSVHEFTGQNIFSATLCCARTEDTQPADQCVFCQRGVARVDRTVIPVYKVDTNEVLYWKRSVTFLKTNLIPMFEEVVNNGKQIVSQVYKIKRTGNGLDTKYSIFQAGTPDDTTVSQFASELQSPMDCGLIQEYDPDFTPRVYTPQQPQNNYNSYNGGFQQPSYGEPQPYYTGMGTSYGQFQPQQPQQPQTTQPAQQGYVQQTQTTFQPQQPMQSQQQNYEIPQATRKTQDIF